ncbi:MAG: hypothetical protein RLZZ387_777 [Chloroflexota bacterium]|jgi:hypothetical protein
MCNITTTISISSSEDGYLLAFPYDRLTVIALRRAVQGARRGASPELRWFPTTPQWWIAARYGDAARSVLSKYAERHGWVLEDHTRNSDAELAAAHERALLAFIAALPPSALRLIGWSSWPRAVELALNTYLDPEVFQQLRGVALAVTRHGSGWVCKLPTTARVLQALIAHQQVTAIAPGHLVAAAPAHASVIHLTDASSTDWLGWSLTATAASHAQRLLGPWHVFAHGDADYAVVEANVYVHHLFSLVPPVPRRQPDLLQLLRRDWPQLGPAALAHAISSARAELWATALARALAEAPLESCASGNGWQDGDYTHPADSLVALLERADAEALRAVLRWPMEDVACTGAWIAAEKVAAAAARRERDRANARERARARLAGRRKDELVALAERHGVTARRSWQPLQPEPPVYLVDQPAQHMAAEQ